MTPQQIRDRKFNVMKNRSHPAQPDYAQERHIEAMREVTEAQTASNVKFQFNALANAVKQTEIFASIAKALVPSVAGATAPSTLAAAERAMERIEANQKPGCYTEEWRDAVVAGTTVPAPETDGIGCKRMGSDAATAVPGDLTDERIMQIHDHLFAKVFAPELIDKAIRYARAIESEVLASNAGAAPAADEPFISRPEFNEMFDKALAAAPSTSPVGAKEKE